MAGVFAAAAAAMVADSNMGIYATYARAGAAWSPIAVRVLVTQPIHEMGMLSARGAVLPVRHAMLPAAALPVDPAPGDRLTIAGVTDLVSVAERDAEGVAWSLILKAADAG